MDSKGAAKHSQGLAILRKQRHKSSRVTMLCYFGVRRMLQHLMRRRVRRMRRRMKSKFHQ